MQVTTELYPRCTTAYLQYLTRTQKSYYIKVSTNGMYTDRQTKCKTDMTFGKSHPPLEWKGTNDRNGQNDHQSTNSLVIIPIYKQMLQTATSMKHSSNSIVVSTQALHTYQLLSVSSNASYTENTRLFFQHLTITE